MRVRGNIDRKNKLNQKNKKKKKVNKLIYKKKKNEPGYSDRKKIIIELQPVQKCLRAKLTLVQKCSFVHIRILL